MGGGNSLMEQVASVGVCLHDKQGKLTHILFGLRNDTKKFTLPGGTIEKGETPLAGALRELEEEAGVKVSEKDLTHVGSDQAVGGDGRVRLIHAYTLKYPLDKKPLVTPLRDPDKECSKLFWVPVGKGKVPDFIAKNLYSKKNVVLQCMEISEKGFDGNLQKSDNKTSWAVQHKGEWHQLEDMWDSGKPAHEGGGNFYKLKGIDDPVHQNDIEDMAPSHEVLAKSSHPYHNGVLLSDDTELRIVSSKDDCQCWGLFKDGHMIAKLKKEFGVDEIKEDWWDSEDTRKSLGDVVKSKIKSYYTLQSQNLYELIAREFFRFDPRIENEGEGYFHRQGIHHNRFEIIKKTAAEKLIKLAVLDFITNNDHNHEGNVLYNKSGDVKLAVIPDIDTDKEIHFPDHMFKYLDSISNMPLSSDFISGYWPEGLQLILQESSHYESDNRKILSRFKDLLQLHPRKVSDLKSFMIKDIKSSKDVMKDD